MPASPELDALIATKVMGWSPSGVTARGFAEWTAGPEGTGWAVTYPGDYDDLRGYRGVWAPSTDIAAAWEVVEQLTRTTKQWFEYEQSCVTYEAIFRHEGGGYRDFEVREEAESAPLAICRAALKAVEAR